MENSTFLLLEADIGTNISNVNPASSDMEPSGMLESTVFGIGYNGVMTMHSMEEYMPDDKELHLYLRVTCLIFLFLIFTIGTVGNVMVTLVIGCSSDMRTSTNIFLVNLSIADVLVLVVCIPTALIEVTHHPERWILGFYLCKFVPLLEAIVANASVLTILAISFERYYAICKPLRANYICTKSRAAWISIAAWIFAILITSPMILMINYKEGINERGEWTARCDVSGGHFWPDTYTISTIILFFLVPFFILLVTYGMIANRLTMDSVTNNCNAKNENHKARKQVIIMLGSVCACFFLCFLPFRVLTLFVILADPEVLGNHEEAYHNFLYFSRIMVYLNSCLNPIFYNVMSSKFRNGFLRLCNRHRKPSSITRHGTFLTNTTTNSTTMSINLGHQSGFQVNPIIQGRGSGQSSPELNGSISRKPGGVNQGKTLKNLLSQSHNNTSCANSFLLSQRTPGYNSSSSITTRPYYPAVSCQDTQPNSPFLKLSRFEASSTNKHVNPNYSAGNFSGIKSDAIYSAYIPGTRRSETVL